MRRYLLSATVAGLLGVLVSPAAGGVAPGDEDESIERAPLAIQRVAQAPAGLRDEAAMVLVGTALIGLAAAVRRAA